MANSFNILNFENSLLIKHWLIVLSTEQLKKANSEYFEYTIFLNRIVDLVNDESVYFLLSSSIRDKLLEILNENRFKPGYEDLRGMTDDIIRAMNQMSALDESQKQMLLANYKAYNETCRKVSLAGYNELSYVVSSDIIAYDNLTGKLDIIENASAFVASLNYFISCAPEIFLNETIMENTRKKLNSIRGQTSPFDFSTKKYIKAVMNRVNCVNKKEE